MITEEGLMKNQTTNKPEFFALLGESSISNTAISVWNCDHTARHVFALQKMFKEKYAVVKNNTWER